MQKIKSTKFEKSMSYNLKKFKEFIKSYYFFIKNISRLIYDYDVRSGKIKWSGAVKEITGYSEKEFNKLGIAGWEKNLHPKDKSFVIRELNRCKKNHVKFDTEYRFLCKNKKYKIFSDVGIFLYDKNKRPYKMLGLIDDVTKEVDFKQKLNQEKIKFEQLFENLKNGVIIYEAINNGENFIIKNFNKGAELIENISRENVIGKKVTNVFPSVKKFGLFKILKRVWKTGNAEFFPIIVYRNKLIKTWRESYLYKLPDGGLVLIYDDVTEKKKAEEELKEDELNLKNLTKNLAEGIIIVSGKGKIIYLNEIVQKILGYSNKELLNQNIFKFVHKTELKKLHGNLKKRLLGKKVPIRYETKFVGKKGNAVFVEISGVKSFWHKELVDIVTIHDITRRKLIEEELRVYRDNLKRLVEEKTLELKAAEKKYRLLYESSADAIMVLEPPLWKFTSGNRATIKMFKVKNEKEFISKSPWEFSPKFQPDGQLSELKAKKMINIALKKGSNFFEWVHKRAYDEEFPATVLISRIKIKDRIYLQATVRDVTKLTEIEKRYEQLFENANDAIFIADAKTKRLIGCNKLAKSLIGYSKKEILSMHVPDLHPEDKIKDVIQVFQNQVKGEAQSFSTEILTKNKVRIPVSINTSLVKIGNKIYVQGIFRDLTEQKKAEEKAKEMEILKAQFISSISHELRTPITPIKSQTQRMLFSELSKEEEKDSLDIILRNTLRLDRLIQELLELTRLRSNQFVIFKKKTNFNEIISDAITDMNSLFVKNDVKVKVELEKLPLVFLDRDRILEVIINLLDNAIKYGHGKIFVSTKKEGKFVVLSVKDNGIGISKTELKSIFTPFFRGKNLSVRKFEGTGLGLAICKGIIDAHKGKIEVQSKIGKGSTFIVKLPLNSAL